MKVSVSLTAADLATLRRYAAEHPEVDGLSGAVRAAVRALRDRELVAEHDLAVAGWAASGQADDWDAVATDGLVGPARDPA